MERIITVWPDGPKWIVSRDDVDTEYGAGNNTGALSTVTIDVVDTEEDAIASALESSADCGLPVYAQDEHGNPRIIEPA